MRESRMCEPRIDGNWNTARRDEHDHRDFSSVTVKFPIFSFLFFPLFFFFVSLKRRAVTDIITPDIHIRGTNFARFVSEKKKKLTLKM